MAAVPDSAVRDLSTRFSGELIRPGDDGYDEARTIFNGMIDRKPALVARARNAQDIAETVRFAAAEGFPLAVRGGGHNVAGYSVIDGAVVADCSLMTDVQVNPEAMTIVSGPGCRWKHVDPAAGAHGLGTVGGTISGTGVAGFTLNGGFGFLSKLYGLACDNLLDTQVVLASGDIVRANEGENPDLFWAIRGGGGNFGVATSFTFRAHEVPIVTFAAYLWPASECVDIMRLYRDYIPTTPPEAAAISMYASAPPLPFVPAEMVGSDVVMVGVVFFGTPEEAQPVLRPLVDRSPAASAAMPLPYPVMQTMLDESAPDGIRNYWRSAYMDTPPGEALEAIAAAGPNKGSPLTMIQLINAGPMPEVDNAFPNREFPFLYHVISEWTDPAEDEQHIAWSRGLSRDLAPYSSERGYLNFVGDADADRVRLTFGDKYARLVELKRKYDPANLFRHNQNIAP